MELRNSRVKRRGSPNGAGLARPALAASLDTTLPEMHHFAGQIRHQGAGRRIVRLETVQIQSRPHARQAHRNLLATGLESAERSALDQAATRVEDQQRDVPGAAQREVEAGAAVE